MEVTLRREMYVNKEKGEQSETCKQHASSDMSLQLHFGKTGEKKKKGKTARLILK